MLRFWLVAYRAVLVLLPARLRRDKGAEMLVVFEALLADCNRTGGVFAVSARAVREILDVLRTSIRLRVSRAGQSSAASRGRPRLAEKKKGLPMDDLSHDMRYALRTWLRRPGFALVTVVTLALAIGANTVIFSVLDAVLLQPLPYLQPDRLVMLWQKLPRLGWERGPVSYPNVEDWRRQARSFEDVAVFQTRVPLPVRMDPDVELVSGARSSGNLFSVLGVQADLGRTFGEADAQPGAPRVVVLSDGLWRRRFGGAESAIGSTFTIGGEAHVVIGVMPAEFDFPSRTDEFWIPLPHMPQMDDRDTHFLQAVARLRPGVTVEAAQSEMQLIFDRMRGEYPDVFRDNQPNVESRREFVSGGSRRMLIVLFGAVTLLLSAACANLANLVLMRGASRARELAVRAALGAGRRRLVRQLVTESGLLAALGAVVGLVIAGAGTRLVVLFGPETLPRRNAIDMDERALVFTLVAAVTSVLLFGLLPALRVSRADQQSVLRDGGRTTSERRSGRVQRLLVVAQVAAAVVLLTGAGLLLNSFVRLTSTSPGFEAQNVLTARVAPPRTRYAEPAQLQAYFDAVLERARRLPGVQRAGGAWAVPFADGGFASGKIVIEGQDTRLGEEPNVGMYPVAGDYFEAMRVPLRAGRSFGVEDRLDTPPVAIVNEAMARRHWPGEEALGKRFKTGGVDEVAEEEWVTVVGVVANTRRFSLEEEESVEAYFPLAQSLWAREMYLVIRAESDVLRVVDALRAELRAVDAEIPLSSVATLSQRVSSSVSQPRFRALLVASFASLACVLALLGIYGVMAFAVATRRHEIGVRMALGARRRQVLAQVLRQGGAILGIGVVLGLVAALATSRSLTSMLYTISPLDAPTYAAVAAFLMLAGLVACYVPARRASNVDPMVTLRED